MKNIHVLPTDKPSRLRYNLSNVLVLTKESYRDYGKQVNQNIYITSDEEIKEGDWVIEHSLNWVFKIHKHGLPNYTPNKKKIILTDNKDLIKDGVQAIDDDFLEWFVKNPSCEEVKLDIETELDAYYRNGVGGARPIKIILKEESRMFSEEEMKQFAFECVGNFLSNDENKVEIKLVDVIIDRINNKFEQFKNK
jgi:hypothetical protein